MCNPRTNLAVKIAQKWAIPKKFAKTWTQPKHRKSEEEEAVQRNLNQSKGNELGIDKN